MGNDLVNKGYFENWKCLRETTSMYNIKFICDSFIITWWFNLSVSSLSWQWRLAMMISRFCISSTRSASSSERLCFSSCIALCSCPRNSRSFSRSLKSKTGWKGDRKSFPGVHQYHRGNDHLYVCEIRYCLPGVWTNRDNEITDYNKDIKL